MAPEYDIELGSLPLKKVAGASFDESKGGTSYDLNEYKHSETETTTASPDLVSVPILQFEQLLTTLKETLHSMRKPDAISIDRTSSGTTLSPDHDVAGEIAFPKTAERPQQSSFLQQTLPPIEHYDNHRTALDISRQENNWSHEKRKWWPALQDLDDVWKTYFPDCQHVESDPEHMDCHPLTDPNFRKSIQSDLVLARICLEWKPTPDIYRFLPWLSLIGFKLNQISGLMRTYAHASLGKNRGIKDILARQCKVLVQTLRYFFEGPTEYLGKSDQFLLGSMLGFCYRRNILPRPTDETDPKVKSNCRVFVYGLWTLNIIQTPRYSFAYTSSEFFQRVPRIGFESQTLPPLLALTKSIGELESLTGEKEPEPIQAEGDNCLCKDLNIQALRNIGGLKLVWTACDRDHLYLDQENGVLRLSWYNMVLVPEFYQYMPMMGNNDVARTWELLLSHRRSQYDFEELETIPFPPELNAYRTSLSKGRLSSQRNLESMMTRRLGQIPDLHDKFVPMVELPRALPYSSFGSYEKRLRVLRHYMDTSKPTGFRNLWHDRRDSLAYYTFWGVIILGGLSVVLGLLSLFVGVAQTIAAFKALEN